MIGREYTLNVLRVIMENDAARDLARSLKR